MVLWFCVRKWGPEFQLLPSSFIAHKCLFHFICFATFPDLFRNSENDFTLKRIHDFNVKEGTNSPSGEFINRDCEKLTFLHFWFCECVELFSQLEKFRVYVRHIRTFYSACCLFGKFTYLFLQAVVNVQM